MCWRRKGKVNLNVFAENKGITLVEVVLSVAILSIITVAFFSIFTSGSTNILYIGQKSNAMAVASSKMEILYTLDTLNLDNVTLGNTLNNLLGPTTITTDPSQLYVYPSDGSIRFYRQAAIPMTGGDGYMVTIVVFYQNGHKYVSLTSFYKDKGGV